MAASHLALGFREYVLVWTCECLTALFLEPPTDGFYSPVNAMAVSMVFTICLTSIAIGSEVAYGIFVSLNASGLLTSYLICIACTFTL